MLGPCRQLQTCPSPTGGFLCDWKSFFLAAVLTGLTVTQRPFTAERNGMPLRSGTLSKMVSKQKELLLMVFLTSLQAGVMGGIP